MIRVAILLSAIGPAFFILGYGIAKARGSWKSEAMWNAFAVGALGTIAAVACELAIQYLLRFAGANPLLDAAANATLVAAIPEEGIKFFILVGLAERHVDARRLQDIVVLALAVSLGFATLENCFYVMSVEDWQGTAALRAITSVSGHGIDGLAMGALLVTARLDAGKSLWRTGRALVVPVALHAAYDFPLFAIAKNVEKIPMTIAWVVVLAASSLFVIMLVNRTLAKAVMADLASARDERSVETTDRLIIGGMVGLIAGPLLAGAAFYAKGIEVASVATVLGIFPVAFGVDAVVTGFRRRTARLNRPRS